MILGNRAILEAMEKGHIVIEPFNSDNLQPNAYDVTLSKHYWIMKDGMKKDPLRFSREIDLSKPEEIDIDSMYVERSAEDGRIRISPGEFLLMCTNEKVGCPWNGTRDDNIVANFITRSSVARLALPQEFAGMGDVNYNAPWTLEVYNMSSFTYILPVNMRIGQFIFFYVDDVDIAYNGSYSPKEWTTRHMLPNVMKLM